ncbi:Membrane-bound lytic murein transglycosylase D precursor [Dissulfuribacter thermophilus]|uniref:Membrane-bound lytic murein transglycosylase D n=1 Tax=Dissulfuribacter thermophilus TaxID=1156395 RepID=A0A1B9F8L0_9BACT|nr:Membrane-bound lytic murein transglycosylase D precursor [Dissulfuribacter thermophilus]
MLGDRFSVKLISLLISVFLLVSACAPVSHKQNLNHALVSTTPKEIDKDVNGSSVILGDDLPLHANEATCSENKGAEVPFFEKIRGKEAVEYLENDYDFSRKYDLERYQRMLDTALELCKTAQELWGKGKLNDALNALDEAYALILKVDPDSKPELLQQKEDLRFLIAKRVMEIHASRFTVANGLHGEIPLILNKEVMEEIKRFQGPERSFFLAAYRRSGRYRPMIVKALKEAGLPEELSWLPLIESGFKVRALSRARALGLWQFIASTGYKFGLNRNTWIDERLDPEKSTRAAIQYLTELHKIFGDWMTVLAAYNCGEGTVLRVIRKQRINYLDHFWDLYQMLPRETVRYVPRFIATLLIVKEPEKFGFTLGEPEPALTFEKVELKKQLHLAQIAEAIGVSKKVLKELNPELRYQITPPGSYALRVPVGKKEVLLAKLEEIDSWSLPKKAFVYHKVRRGETLSSIALRYGARIRDIELANNIRHRNLIRVGQTLKVPLTGKGPNIPRQLYAKKKKKFKRYVVQRGDSLWLIARKFNTSVTSIKKANGLRSNCLSVGQVLKIP